MPRARGRPLTELELEHLRLLLEIRDRAHEGLRKYDSQLEDFVLACRESGCSVRGIADALGVGASTVQTWTNNARQRNAD